MQLHTILGSTFIESDLKKGFTYNPQNSLEEAIFFITQERFVTVGILFELEILTVESKKLNVASSCLSIFVSFPFPSAIHKGKLFKN